METPQNMSTGVRGGGDTSQSWIGDDPDLTRSANSTPETQKLLADVSSCPPISRADGYRPVIARTARRVTDPHPATVASEINFETVTRGTMTSISPECHHRCVQSVLSFSSSIAEEESYSHFTEQVHSEESLLSVSFRTPHVEKISEEEYSESSLMSGVRALILFLAVLSLTCLRLWERDQMRATGDNFRRLAAMHDLLNSSIAMEKSRFLFWLFCENDG